MTLRFLGLSGDRWELIANVVTVLGVAGIAWAVYQWNAQIRADRAQQTLERIDLWIEQGYNDDLVALSAITGAIDREFTELRHEDGKSPPTDEELALKVLENEANDARFRRVTFFFTYLGLCIEAKVCACQTARTYFGDALIPFLKIFGTRIDSDGSFDREAVRILEARFSQDCAY